MEYRKVREDYVIRFDKGEEITERLVKFANIEGIGCASISAIGASSDFICGALNLSEMEYSFKEYHGDYEIASMSGSITCKDGKPYMHIHGVFANSKGEVVAGHVAKAKISVTCEMFVHVLDGTVERVWSEEAGANLMRITNE